MRKQHLMTIFTTIHDTIPSKAFLTTFRTSDRYFTRKRKMTFVGLITFITNFLSKSLQAELDHYFKQTGNESRISQQAFSKARQKIKPEAFKHLFEITVRGMMDDSQMTRFKGYRVFAIDGTELYLEPTKELVARYGQKKNNLNCKAKVSMLCEVHEGIIIDAQMEAYYTSERELALKHLEAFEAYHQKKDLIIFDRGYPSRKLIATLHDKEMKYLMRVQRSFYSLIDESTQEDFYLTMAYQKKSYKVRVVKLELPTGETETLLTNLGRKSFKKSEFMALYFKRWPIETQYNTLKNKLEIENFSGRTLISVQQDFYATMYLSNLVAITKIMSDEEIKKQAKDKELKYKYQTNESRLISQLKDEMILCLLIEDPTKRSEVMERIIQAAARNKSPIRSERSFDRKDPEKRRRSIRRYRKKSL